MLLTQRFLASILIIFAVSLFTARAEAADGFVRISSESEFNKLVVGRKLYLDKNYFTIRKNGSLKGKFGGKVLKGTWEWREGFFCRKLTTHSKNTDCQLWEANGNQFLATRNRGTGKAFTYVTK